MYKHQYKQQQSPYPNPHNNHPTTSSPDYYEDSNSEIYIDQTYPYDAYPQQPPPPPPRVSRSQQLPPSTPLPPTSMHPHHGYHHHQTPSEYSSVLSKPKSTTSTKNKGGVVVETMSAPNPCCPDSKGVCCILLLVNLGLILVTLGFSIVLQLFEPPFVWYCGLLFLIVGFIALIASLLFCMRICTFSRYSSSSSSTSGHPHHSTSPQSELFWTHHWQKRINLPGMSSSRSATHNPQDNQSSSSPDNIVFSSNHNKQHSYIA